MARRSSHAADPALAAARPPARVRLRLETPDGRRAHGGVPVLRLGGEFDIDTVPEIDRFLRRRLGPLYQRRTLVMDLGEVTFVDSSFVGFVVRLVGDQRQGGGELVLARPAGHVRSLLCMVGLPNLVPVYESVDEALLAVREASGPLIPPAFGLTAGPRHRGQAAGPPGGGAPAGPA